MKNPLSTSLTRRGVIASSVALAAAGKVAAAQDATPAAVPAYDGSNVKITYGYWDDNQTEGMKQQIEAFNKVQPNIEVELQMVPWADYWTKLQTAVAGGEAFDVFWLNSATCPVYASAGALVSLDGLFADGMLNRANYPEQVLALYNYQGVQYATPREYDTIALFYNKDMFDAAGEAYPDETWDWAKMIEVAKRFTDENAGTWGLGLQNSWQENWYNFIFSNEGDLLNEDRTACVVADDANSAEALTTNVQWMIDGLSPDMTVQQNNPVADTLFPGGLVAMMPGGSFRAKTLAKADASIDVAMLPTGKVSSGVIHGLGNVVWSGSKNPGAAVEFARFLATEEAERILGESGIGLPAYIGLEETWLSSLTDMNAQVFVDSAKTARIVPDPEVGFEWQTKFQDAVLSGYNGELEPDAVPQAAQDAANAVL